MISSYHDDTNHLIPVPVVTNFENDDVNVFIATNGTYQETKKTISSYHDDTNDLIPVPVVTIFENDDVKVTTRRDTKYGTLPQLMTILVAILFVVAMLNFSSSEKSFWVESNGDGVAIQNVQWTDRFGTVHTKSWPLNGMTTASITTHGRWWETEHHDGIRTGSIEWIDSLGKTHTQSWSCTATPKRLLTAASIAGNGNWLEAWTQKSHVDPWAHNDDEVKKNVQTISTNLENTDDLH